MPFLQKIFGYDPTKASIKTEFIAGKTSFLAMAYILAVLPSLYSTLDPALQAPVFTAVALSTIIGTLIMAFYVKLPIAIAPGIGLATFFIYTVCIEMGHTWQYAMTAVLFEGIIFTILTLCNVRDAIINALPRSLRVALGVGIGLFIAVYGLTSSGMIVNNGHTILALGNITDKNVILTIIGLLISCTLIAAKVKGAIIIGIIATTLIGIPMGITKCTGIVSMPCSIEPVFCKFDWSSVFSIEMFLTVFAFLFLEIFNSVGTLIGICGKMNIIDKNGNIPIIKQAFFSDAIATIVSATLGAGASTTYIESLSGVVAGGKSGLASLFTATGFIFALFLSPLFLSIPSAAIAPLFIIIGSFILSEIRKIDIENYCESIPAFLCIIMIPLTYSIIKGMSIGVISYVVINVLCGNYKKISINSYIIAAIFGVGLVLM